MLNKIEKKLLKTMKAKKAKLSKEKKNLRDVNKKMMEINHRPLDPKELEIFQKKYAARDLDKMTEREKHHMRLLNGDSMTYRQRQAASSNDMDAVERMARDARNRRKGDFAMTERQRRSA